MVQLKVYVGGKKWNIKKKYFDATLFNLDDM